jgi:hypothetical protein
MVNNINTKWREQFHASRCAEARGQPLSRNPSIYLPQTQEQTFDPSSRTWQAHFPKKEITQEKGRLKEKEREFVKIESPNMPMDSEASQNPKKPKLYVIFFLFLCNLFGYRL